MAHGCKLSTVATVKREFSKSKLRLNLHNIHFYNSFHLSIDTTLLPLINLSYGIKSLLRTFNSKQVISLLVRFDCKHANA